MAAPHPVDLAMTAPSMAGSQLMGSTKIRLAPPGT